MGAMEPTHNSLLGRRHWLLKTAAISGAAYCRASTSLFAGQATQSDAGDSEGVKIGLVADPQYANVAPSGSRYYANSVAKLSEAIATFNQRSVRLAINLGDLIDRDWSSYEDILAPLRQLHAPMFHVLGNHDFDVSEELKSEVSAKLGMPSRYYSQVIDKWRLLFLDTNDVSTYAHRKADSITKVADVRRSVLASRKLSNAQLWNGGVGDEQMVWMADECSKAIQNGERVVVFSHHPVSPSNSHNAWNDTELVELVKREKAIVAWFNGHNHVGNFAEVEGVPFITLKGMVETETENAFSILTLNEDHLSLQGFGREVDRTCGFRRP